MNELDVNVSTTKAPTYTSDHATINNNGSTSTSYTVEAGRNCSPTIKFRPVDTEIVLPLFGFFGNDGNKFGIKDVKFSSDKVIVFWKDNTKTIVTMDSTESRYDVEKAIMACFTKKALSFMPTAKERSLDRMLDKWTEKFKTQEKTIKAQIKEIKERKAKKSESK